MKKFFVAFALALVLTASAAHAATYEFTTPPTNIDNFTMFGSDGLDANFAGFEYWGNSIIFDYMMGAGNGATITFSATAILDSIDFTSWGYQAFSGKAYDASGAETIFDDTNFASLILNKAWNSLYFEGTYGMAKVEAHATPIPGAALLLGSGLIGLVGLRRKYLA